MMRYLLDSNIFIQAKNEYYGFDFCPAFWEWLLVQNVAGKVFSIENVSDELHRHRDNLAEWIDQNGRELFRSHDEAVEEALKPIVAWVNHRNYDRRAVSTFLKGADCWLVAHARAHNFTVVTHETSAPLSKRSVKIPDVCDGFEIETVTPYKMLRNERARFVLGGAAHGAVKRQKKYLARRGTSRR